MWNLTCILNPGFVNTQRILRSLHSLSTSHSNVSMVLLFDTTYQPLSWGYKTMRISTSGSRHSHQWRWGALLELAWWILFGILLFKNKQWMAQTWHWAKLSTVWSCNSALYTKTPRSVDHLCRGLCHPLFTLRFYSPFRIPPAQYDGMG